MPFNSQELKYPRELKTWIKKKKKTFKNLVSMLIVKEQS